MVRSEDPGPERLAEGLPGGRVAADDPVLQRALEMDTTVRLVAPDGWRGVQARENVIKAALWGILGDEAEVERLFLIVKAQPEY